MTFSTAEYEAHDATGLAALVRAGEINARELAQTAIARIEALNPQVNAVILKAYDQALDELAARTDRPAFLGVPYLVKDLHAPVRGLSLTNGSRMFVDPPATFDSTLIARLRAAGFVMLGRTNSPEFGLSASTEPHRYGATRNPWNLDRIAGGSSGGSGAAVASGMLPAAHATDSGGSIRIPASCNGLVGLKPSRGRSVAGGRPDPGIDISVNGCVSRSVRDTAAWLAATEQAGGNATFAPVGVVTGASTQRLRIRMDIPNALGREPDAEVRAAVEAAAALCRSLGHDVREGRPQIDGQQFTADFILLWAAGAAEVVALVQSQAAGAPLDQLLETLTLDLATHYQQQGQAALEAAIVRLREVEARYASFFSDADVYLTPVLAKPPIALGQIAGSLGMAAFSTLTDYVGYTPLENIAGAPAISLPLAWSSGGLPIGVHFAAAKGQERRLLELAYELEQAQPWAARKPGINAG
jgi:amidase